MWAAGCPLSRLLTDTDGSCFRLRCRIVYYGAKHFRSERSFKVAVLELHCG